MLEGSNIHCIAPCLVTAKEVKQVLSCLDPNKDCGPYNIPSSMLKHYRFFISEPLVVLKNYRQVIILSALTKTFKKLVSLRISPLIKNIISPKKQIKLLNAHLVEESIEAAMFMRLQLSANKLLEVGSNKCCSGEYA
ncbi:hypothetical protein J6590_079865 [Homalodisca vitripennis]|nr:hypothetical protein J6590_079865 [Homalodisca vitripennis]